MTAMEYKNITLEKKGNVAVIALNRPKVLNALNGELLLELIDAAGKAGADDEVRVLVIHGAGDKAFAAGADIGEINAVRNPHEAMELADRGQRACLALEKLKKPVIAAINGFALGAGLELALACDIRVAADNARLGLPEVNLGILPGAGGTQRMARLLGKGMAKLLIFSADHVDSTEALRIGLVEKVVPAAELMDFTMALAEKIASKGPLAIAGAKEAIEEGMNCDLERGLLIEVRNFAVLCSTEDRLEGTAAFLEKRKARFKGK